MTDVEKLIERLDDVRWQSGIMEDTAREAAAMLRSLAAENRKLWASNREYADGIELYYAKLEKAEDEIRMLRDWTPSTRHP